MAGEGSPSRPGGGQLRQRVTVRVPADGAPLPSGFVPRTFTDHTVSAGVVPLDSREDDRNGGASHRSGYAVLMRIDPRYVVGPDSVIVYRGETLEVSGVEYDREAGWVRLRAERAA